MKENESWDEKVVWDEVARDEKTQEKSRGMMFKAVGNRALTKRRQEICFKTGLGKNEEVAWRRGGW